MRSLRFGSAAAIALNAIAGTAAASVTVDYSLDIGGSNSNPLDGMTARATFELDGTQLWILLENSSTGVPLHTNAAQSLLTTLAFDLPSGVDVVSGGSATIGEGSRGLGIWDGLFEGDDVSDEWLWTNDRATGILDDFRQVISTRAGLGDASGNRFAGERGPSVGGPFGGIAADPVLVDLPDNRPAVSDSVHFVLNLSETISESELAEVASNSITGYGTTFQYLAIPEPAVLPLMIAWGLVGRRRRRS